MVRGDLNIRLVVNATKFQMGRYVFKFVPTGGVGGTCRNPWISMHRANIVAVSQLPGLEVELGVDTEATMTIPFRSCYQGIVYPNLSATSHFGSPGEVFFYPYSPVAAAAGPLTATYTLWGSLTNIKLLSLAVPQMGVMEEEKKQNNLQSISESTSVSASSVAKAAIPIITSTMPAWASNVSRVALNTLGWSRPTNSAPVSRVSHRELAYHANCDVADTSIPLSLTSGASVATRPDVSTTTIDEQSLSYLSARDAIFHDEEWNASRVAGDILTTLEVTPSVYYKAYTDTATAYKQYTPVGHMSTLFSMWRGSLIFKIRFIKTCFHSGRISIFFQPSDAYTAPTSYVGAQNDSVWLSRKIVDLASVSEVEFTVPFVFDNDWAWCSESIGKIYITVLDPLVAPATVTNYVRLLTSVRGGPDFSYSIPAERPRQTFVPAVMQMGDMGDGRRVNLGIMGDKLIGPTVIPEAYCIGEKITSILQLLKRYKQFYSGPNSAGATPTNTSIRPFHHGVSVYSGGALRNTGFNDTYAFCSNMFTFSNGGVRLRILNTIVGNISANLLYLPNATGDILSKTSMSLNASITSSPVCQLFTNTNTAEIAIPQYHKQHTRAVAAQIMNYGYIGNSALIPENPSVFININTPVDASASTTVFYSRSVDDDFYLSGFISTVPLLDNAF